jgi:hypothetical protein
MIFKKYTFLVFAFLILVFISSCEKVIQVDVPEGETLLVVDAWLNNKPENQVVRLTTTSPVFSSSSTPAALGATVNIKDLSNGKVYPFLETAGTGNYVYTPTTNDTFNIVGHQYELQISYKGYNYKSISSSYKTTQIDTVGFNKLTDFGDTTVRGYAPWLFGKDIPNEKNFYWIKTYKNGKFFNASSNVNIAEDGGGGEGSDGLCFIPPIAYFSVTPFDNPFKLNDVLTVEVYSINKNSYEYLIQLVTQVNNSQAGLFAVTPENLRTNILPLTENSPRVLGWFNIGTVSSKSFSCKDIPVENVFLGGYFCP